MTLLLQARAHLARRKRGEALAVLHQAVRTTPDHPETLFLLARAHMMANDAFAAVAVLEHLQTLAPAWPGLPELLAGAYRRDARHEDVLRLAEHHPAGRDMLYEVGMARAHLGDGAGALAAFDALLEREPDHAAAWVGSHAPALELLGPEEALRRLRLGAVQPGANGKYWGALCALLLLLGRAEEADAVQRERIDGQPRRQALVDGVRAILPHLTPQTRLFGVSASLLRWAVSQAAAPGLVLEFGVRRGASIAQIAAVAGQAVHGFDSFEGLPEAWNNEGRGVMTTGLSLPAVPENVALHAGWFADSLPPFLAEHPEPLRFANIDCDIYSSTRTVLTSLAGRIRPDSVLVFDEYIGNRNWQDDEFKAFQEFVAAQGVRYEIIAVAPHTKQVAMRIG